MMIPSPLARLRTSAATIQRTVFLLAIIYSVIMSAFSIVQHYGLKTQMNDLGNMDHAIWMASKGDWSMPQTNCSDGIVRSRFGIHANLIFWVLAPLYWLWPHPEILLILTSCACAMAGVGLYFFAREKIGNSWWAAIPAISFWLSPLVQEANLFDFHVVTLAAAFFVWMIWAFDTGRTKTGWTLFTLAVLCQENIPLVMIFYGIFLLLDRRTSLGLRVLVISAAYLIFLHKIFVPVFNAGNGLWASPINRYTWLGTHLSAVPTHVVHQLPDIISQILRPDHLRFVLYLLVSGSIVAFRRWQMLLLIIPALLESLLSNNVWTTRITGTYYWIVPESVIISAVILTAQKFAGRSQKIALLYLLGSTILLSWAFSPLPYGMGSSWDNYALNTKEYQTLKEIRELIPPNAPLSIQNNLGPHFSHRENIATFPRQLKTANYIILHLRHLSGKNTGYFFRPSILLTIPSGKIDGIIDFLNSNKTDWKLLLKRGGFYVFERDQSSPQERQETLQSMAIDLSILRAQLKQAWRGNPRIATYLTSDVSWTDLSQNLK